MINFNQKFKHTKNWRKAALTFEREGRYCSHLTGSTDWIKFWEEEARRCMEGYEDPEAGWISGYHYFYLNYCVIKAQVKKLIKTRHGEVERTMREDRFPSFWDYDHYFFQAVQDAEDEGRHLAVIKARRKGYSYKNAAMMCRNYYFIPGAKNFAFASDEKFLVGDGIVFKAWDFMSFIDNSTPWGKKRQKINLKLHRRASIITKDETGKEIEMGYKSEIMGITLGNNPGKSRGIAGRLILWEESGENRHLVDAWNIARQSVEEYGHGFGQMIAFGTSSAGNISFEGLRAMFYNPAAYGCIEFPDIWEGVPTDRTCGLFVPAWTNLEGLEYKGQKLMDEDGNSNRDASIDYIMETIRGPLKGMKDQAIIDKTISEAPITIREATMVFTGNIYPKAELINHLAELELHPEISGAKQVGELVLQSNGSLKWEQKKYGDILGYPIDDRKNPDRSGSIVIWEHPVEETGAGLYFVAVDPYDHDTGTSLGSAIVWKRFQSFEQYYDFPVAEYTGRPLTADMFYENVRKLAIYYKAQVWYENNVKGIQVYFKNKGCEYMLASSPDIIKDILGETNVDRQTGVHMTEQIKMYAIGRLRDWMLEEYAEGRINLYKILSIPILQELVSYNDVDNFDRHSALLIAMIARDQMHKVQVKQHDDLVKKNFFGGNVFGDGWFTQNSPRPHKPFQF